MPDLLFPGQAPSSFASPSGVLEDQAERDYGPVFGERLVPLVLMRCLACGRHGRCRGDWDEAQQRYRWYCAGCFVYETQMGLALYAEIGEALTDLCDLLTACGQRLVAIRTTAGTEKTPARWEAQIATGQWLVWDKGWYHAA